MRPPVPLACSVLIAVSAHKVAIQRQLDFIVAEEDVEFPLCRRCGRRCRLDRASRHEGESAIHRRDGWIAHRALDVAI